MKKVMLMIVVAVLLLGCENNKEREFEIMQDNIDNISIAIKRNNENLRLIQDHILVYGPESEKFRKSLTK